MISYKKLVGKLGYQEDIHGGMSIIKVKGCPRCLHAGGNWSNSSNCGSRCRNANNVRSNVNANIGGRGVIRYLKRNG